jgi:hypothetical protein
MILFKKIIARVVKKYFNNVKEVLPDDDDLELIKENFNGKNRRRL